MSPDDLLRQQLSDLAVPEPDSAAIDRALRQATTVLGSTHLVRVDPVRRWTAFFTEPSWAVAAAAAAIVLLAGLGATLVTGRSEGKRPPPLSAERTVLSQMEVLFGAQLDAVIERPDRAPDIHLSAGAAGTIQPSLAQPVLIQFHRPGSTGSTRVLSFSGREVCVMLGERRICFVPLVTGRDEVILSGETFCWSPEQPSGGFDGYKVTARLLPRS